MNRYRLMTSLLFLAATGLSGVTVPASAAFTIKSGEILSSDGNTYVGASPRIREHLKAQAREQGEVGGITGKNVYVVVDENISFIPVRDIAGRPDEEMIEIIGDQVIQDVTGIETISFKQFQDAQKLSDELGIPLSELAENPSLAGLSDELADQLTELSAESGIDLENLASLSSALDQLPEDRFADITESLGELIESGFADEVNETLAALDEQGLLDDALSYDSYADCVGQGGSNCDDINELIGDGPPQE